MGMGWVQGGHGVGTGWAWGAPPPAGTGCLTPSSLDRGICSICSKTLPVPATQVGQKGFDREKRGEEMLSPWSGPAETLTKSDQARGCSGQKGGVKEGFLETQRSCIGMSRRDVPGAAARDPLLAAAQDLLAGSLSRSLSYRFLPWKEKAPAQRAVSLNGGQSTLPLPDRLFAWQLKWPFPVGRGDGGTCTGQ